uniref:Uncharacterized protein n=1 Tax=Arundo donax TaxID=35708 RepID=A0A0A8Z2K5_ARUDO
MPPIWFHLTWMNLLDLHQFSKACHH